MRENGDDKEDEYFDADEVGGMFIMTRPLAGLSQQEKVFGPSLHILSQIYFAIGTNTFWYFGPKVFFLPLHILGTHVWNFFLIIVIVVIVIVIIFTFIDRRRCHIIVDYLWTLVNFFTFFTVVNSKSWQQ